MQYTQEQKRKIFDKLPEDLKEAILSVENSEKLRKIYDQHGLMLDQAAELGDETGLFMLGITKQDEYVKNISKRLNVPYDKAEKITIDVNKEIFDSIRSSLQEIQKRHEKEETESVVVPIQPPTPKPDISSLEKIGGFTIEKAPHQSASPIYKDTNLNREAVLKDIEDAGKKTSDSGVSFVDHLLNKPTTTPPPETLKTPPTPPKPPAAPQNPTKYSADPYREPIE